MAVLSIKNKFIHGLPLPFAQFISHTTPCTDNLIISILTTYLEHISSNVVLQCPVKGVEDLNDLLLFKDGEQAVQQDLEADWDGLGPKQHQTADIKHHVAVYDLHLAALVHVMHLQFTQS